MVGQEATLTDSVWQVVRGQTLKNGLRITQARVQSGVIDVIYEVRLHVTVKLLSWR